MIIVQNYIQSAKVLKKIEIKEGKSKIIRYFCIVKRFKYNFRCIFAVLLIILTTKASAQQTEVPQWVDSVDISLLTCGTGTGGLVVLWTHRSSHRRPCPWQ